MLKKKVQVGASGRIFLQFGFDEDFHLKPIECALKGGAPCFTELCAEARLSEANPANKPFSLFSIIFLTCILCEIAIKFRQD